MRKTKNNRLHAKPSHAKNSYILVDLGFYFFTQRPSFTCISQVTHNGCAQESTNASPSTP
jgi:hypothetical protein